MDLVICKAHIIHYHINPLQSVALGQSYFAHLDYLVVHCWIWTTSLHPTIITPVGILNVWRYVQLFKGVVGFMSNGAPCYYIVIIFIDSFFISQPHILFLKHHFKIIFIKYRQHIHFYMKMSIFLLLFFCDAQSLEPAAYTP